MNKSVKKPIVGILGGIASGKTTVSLELGKLGCAVIDADEIAHQLLDQPDVYKEVLANFGREILDQSKKVDRRKLGQVVFADKDKLAILNQILHRRVLEKVESLIDTHNGCPNVKAIVLDMPLLVEVGWDKRCDYIVFVQCKRHLRQQRARKKGILAKNKLKIRENLQISLDNKVAIADNVINNNSGFLALAGQVIDVFSCIMEKWGSLS